MMRTDIDHLLDHALGDDPRLALYGACRLKAEYEWLEQRAVALARRNGYDWGRIGRLLGISRQAARQRFARLQPALPPSARPSARDMWSLERDEIATRSNVLTEESYIAGLGDGDIVVW